jgi:hypothetical protein
MDPLRCASTLVEQGLRDILVAWTEAVAGAAGILSLGEIAKAAVTATAHDAAQLAHTTRLEVGKMASVAVVPGMVDVHMSHFAVVLPFVEEVQPVAPLAVAAGGHMTQLVDVALAVLGRMIHSAAMVAGHMIQLVAAAVAHKILPAAVAALLTVHVALVELALTVSKMMVRKAHVHFHPAGTDVDAKQTSQHRRLACMTASVAAAPVHCPMFVIALVLPAH